MDTLFKLTLFLTLMAFDKLWKGIKAIFTLNGRITWSKQ